MVTPFEGLAQSLNRVTLGTATILPMAADPTSATTDAPAPHTQKGEQSRRAILDAAIARFGRDGFRATSVANIARDAQVSGTLAYAYFDNKEALFLAALDDDAASVIRMGVSSVLADAEDESWRAALIPALLGAVEQHPLARRVLSGLEPHVTDRMIDLPALSELRAAVARRLSEGQDAGRVRPDIEPTRVASGVVSIFISLLMSVLQFGGQGVADYGPDVLAVFEAAIDPPRS